MSARTLKQALVTSLVVAVVFVAGIDIHSLTGARLIPLSEQQVQDIQKRAELMKQFSQGESNYQ